VTGTGPPAVPLASAGHGWFLALFPLLAAGIAAVFSAQLLRRFVSRRRPFEGLWVVALAMFAAASFAMFLGVATGWTALEFRVYWLLGAVLNVPYLFAGELYLLSRRRVVADAALAALLVGTAFAAWKVMAAPVDHAALAKALPLGKDVFGDESAAYRIAQIYAFPAYFLLLGGIVWSAWQMRRRPELRSRTAGTLAIAIGATIVAIGSGIGAGFNIVPLFSVSLAAGVSVMYAGFRAVTRPGAPPRPAESPAAG
jgi:hypothetical protein